MSKQTIYLKQKKLHSVLLFSNYWIFSFLIKIRFSITQNERMNL